MAGVLYRSGRVHHPTNGAPLPATAAPAAFLADLAGSLRLFSRLPVPRLGPEDDPARLPDFRRAGAVLPLAGLIIALPAAAILALAVALGLPPLAAGALSVAAAFLITGGLHEDGLADTADGYAAGGTPERRLAIMRDSRVGAHGAGALAVAMMLRAALASGLAAAGAWPAGLALLAAGAVSRTAIVALWHLTPPARSDGLSVTAGRPERSATLVALALGLAAALLALPAAGTVGVTAGIALAALAVLALRQWCRRALGGQTGDVLGATQQFGEIAFLTGLLI